MPLYPFESNGEYQEFFFPMRDAPKIGDTIERDGKTWTRVVDCIVGEAVNTVTNKYPYVSMRHGAFLPGAQHDSQGRSIIRSQSHEREWMAKNNLARD